MLKREILASHTLKCFIDSTTAVADLKFLNFCLIYKSFAYCCYSCLPAAGATSISCSHPAGTGSLNNGPSPSEATGVGPLWPSPSASAKILRHEFFLLAYSNWNQTNLPITTARSSSADDVDLLMRAEMKTRQLLQEICDFFHKDISTSTHNIRNSALKGERWGPSQCFRDGRWHHIGPKFNATESNENWTGGTWDVVGKHGMSVLDVGFPQLSSQCIKVGYFKFWDEKVEKITNKTSKLPIFLAL